MKTKNTYSIEKTRAIVPLITLLTIMATALTSCMKYSDYVPSGLNADLTLSSDKSSCQLTQKGALSTNALTYTWTTGSNNGTNASISYELQVDLAGNNFSNPIVYDMKKATYNKAFTVGALNDTLLNYWKINPGTKTSIESRVIAHINTDPEITETSNVVATDVTHYKPVSSTLFLYGTASPSGSDIAGATALTADKNEPTIFIYEGWLDAGSFVLTVNKNSDMLQDIYEKNISDTTKMVLHTGSSTDYSKWITGEGAIYKIEVSLIDLTVNITKEEGVEFTKMFMVGDATPNGWDISNATEMVQSKDNPFVFTYDGMLYKGDFKFPVNRNSNWGQDMFMMGADSTKVYRHNGGDSDDSKWHIYEDGWYSVVLDIQNMTLSYSRLKSLYIVGSAASCGWTITDAVQLTQGSTNYEFIFTGALSAGEFKFPVNRNSDWSQDMFMMDPTDKTKIYFHNGGASDDSKWTISSGDAGNYVLTVNLKTLTINIDKQ